MEVVVMNSSSQYVSRRGSASLQQTNACSKRSHFDMKGYKVPSRWVDHDYYLSNVLRIPSDTTEDEIDQKLKHTAEDLGLNALQLKTNVEAITSSMSATTIASDPTIQSSVTSQSTAPTSCSSSEVRPIPPPADKIDTESSQNKDQVPAILTDIEKKRRNTGFRIGFRKMTGLSKKKKTGTSSALTSISSYSDLDASLHDDGHSITSDLKSPSLKSKESSGLWSNRLSTTGKSSYEEEESLIDHDALRRSMECKEMISLRARQLEERQRFLDYQSELVSKIRTQRDAIKAQRIEGHQRVIHEQMTKNEKACEDLESRQLEEELKMVKEQDTEKRTVMVRLRHMEAYCQTPSPPPTPSDITFATRFGLPGEPSSARGSFDSSAVPLSPLSPLYIAERKVTDKDYHNLAQQYRERDAMDNLHASKINVLRGKQKRAVENFMLKRERDIEKIEQEQQKELDTVDFEFGRQEADCRSEFDILRRRLESRWRLQAKIERKKREDTTGLKFESLPDVLCVDNCSVELMIRPPIPISRSPRDLPKLTTISAR